MFYKPKDVVSGDFYWWDQRGPLFFAAAVDCTGHGVPGAFMSVISNNLLTDMVRLTDLKDPKAIMAHLDTKMQDVLKQGQDAENSALDGMDIALIVYDTEQQCVHFGGAHNPLFLVRGGELQQFAGSKRAIGGNTFDTGVVPEFESHTVALEPGDMLYLFSDGFQDQFGGERGKKFTRKRFRTLLTDHATQDPDTIHSKLEAAFQEWMGDYEQLDDVLVMGLRYKA